jgi:hypothetical protein
VNEMPQKLMRERIAEQTKRDAIARKKLAIEKAKVPRCCLPPRLSLLLAARPPRDWSI